MKKKSLEETIWSGMQYYACAADKIDTRLNLIKAT